MRDVIRLSPLRACSSARWPVLWLLLCGLAGCATPRGELDLQTPASPYRWPPPPEAARIQWEGELRGEDNFPREGGGQGRRMLAWLTGLMLGEDEPLRLQRPMSGAVDPALGRIYVSDVGLRALVVFDTRERRVALWRGAGEFSFHTPIAVAVLPDSSLWVSDAEQGVVHLDAAGRLRGRLPRARLQRPTGLCRDARGRLVVADSAAHRLALFDVEGVFLGYWGGKGRSPGRFNGPTHVACSPDGLIAVADTLNARVQVLDGQGRVVRILGRRGAFLGDTPRPKGVAWDAQGRLYVVESLFDHLLVYDRDGRALLPIGGSGSSPGRFQLPAGAWSDGEGRLYIADMFNRRVAVLRLLEGQREAGRARK